MRPPRATGVLAEREVDPEAGYATVVGLSLVFVVVSLGFLVATLGGVAATRHRAEAIADLSALAAAKHAVEGVDGACGAARRLVEEQGARLIECGLDGLDAIVVVGVAPPGRVASFGLVRGRARAGRR